MCRHASQSDSIPANSHLILTEHHVDCNRHPFDRGGLWKLLLVERSENSIAQEANICQLSLHQKSKSRLSPNTRHPVTMSTVQLPMRLLLPYRKDILHSAHRRSQTWYQAARRCRHAQDQLRRG